MLDAVTFQCVTPSAVDLNLNIDPDVGYPLTYEFYLDQLIITQVRLPLHNGAMLPQAKPLSIKCKDDTKRK